MVLNTRVITSMERSTDMESSTGLMDQTIKESSRITTFMAKDSISGAMAELTMASGSSTKCTALVSLPGTTVASMKESTTTIRSKARAPLFGLMDASTSEAG